MTYLAKFDSDGRRGATYPCDSTITPERKQEMIADGYIEISEEDWQTYVSDHGENGTGMIRDPETGRPVSAPPYIPTKEEKHAQLDAQYDADVAELTRYYTEAALEDDADLQEEIKAELAEIKATYIEERKKIEDEEE